MKKILAVIASMALLAVSASAATGAPDPGGRATLVIDYATRLHLESILKMLAIEDGLTLVTLDDQPTKLDDRQIAREALEKPSAVSIPVKIVGVRYMSDGRGVFTTDSGTVWRETVVTPTNQRLRPQREYTGVISRGIFGGFRLNVEGIVREFKVEPIESR